MIGVPELSPNTQAAIDLLGIIHRSRPLQLAAIVSDGPFEARTFYPSQEEPAFSWIDQRQGRANLDFHVNNLKPGVQNVTAKVKDWQEQTFREEDFNGAGDIGVLAGSASGDPVDVYCPEMAVLGKPRMMDTGVVVGTPPGLAARCGQATIKAWIDQNQQDPNSGVPSR